MQQQAKIAASPSTSSPPCKAPHNPVALPDDILIQSRQFKLPGKKQLQQSPSEWKVLVVDVTETPLLFAPKKQRRYREWLELAPYSKSPSSS